MNYTLLASINWNKFLIVIAIAFALAIVFSVLILLIDKLCHKQEDERLVKITDNLAGANCGGCGFAGCEAFAKALLEGKAKVTDCGVTKAENKAIISEVLGVPYAVEEDCFAVVKCAGGKRSKDNFKFVGNSGCISQSAYFGGRKICSYGCLGEGSCAETCPYGALSVKDGVCSVNKVLCQTCKVCVNKCPKHVIELIPKSAKVYVACSSKCKGKEVIATCEVGCIGCGLCAKNCPNGAIVMENNLPKIDYKKCSGCKVCVTKCPRKTIREL